MALADVRFGAHYGLKLDIARGPKVPMNRDRAVHSITSSANKRNSRGITSPSSFAVFRLKTNSSFVGCSTGRSAGLAPLRILSTYVAARRNRSGKLAPEDLRAPASHTSLAAYIAGSRLFAANSTMRLCSPYNIGLGN